MSTENKDGSNPITYYDGKKLLSVLTIDKTYLEDLIKIPKDKVKEKYHCVCLIGSTGTGKSSTCNTLIGSSGSSDNRFFKESQYIVSETYKTVGVITKWFGDKNNSEILILDTPGLGDSLGRDSNHIAEMIVALQTVGYVHSFVICFNSQQPRFDEHLKAMMKIFASMFTVEFFHNIILCFTRYSYNSVTMLQREEGGVSEDSIISEWIASFSGEYGVRLHPHQFAFVDNMYNTSNEKIKMTFTDLELSLFKKQLVHIMDVTKNSTPFMCHDIKSVLSKNDALHKALIDQREVVSKLEDKYKDEVTKLEEKVADERKAYELKLQQERDEKDRLVREEQEKLAKAIADWDAKEQKHNNYIKTQTEAYNSSVAAAKLREQELIKEKDRQKDEYVAAQNRMFADSKRLSEDHDRRLREIGNDKEKKITELYSQISSLNSKYYTDMASKDRTYNDYVRKYESDMLSLRTQKDNTISSLNNTVSSLNDRINTLKRTCVHCRSTDPTGFCGYHSHTPVNYGLFTNVTMNGEKVNLVCVSHYCNCGVCGQESKMGQNTYKGQGIGHSNLSDAEKGQQFLRMGNCKHQTLG